MADDSKYPTRIAPYGLRMPPDLKARIQASADENARSLHAEILHALEEVYPAPKPFHPMEFAYEEWLKSDLGLGKGDRTSEADRAALAEKVNRRLKDEGARIRVHIDKNGSLVVGAADDLPPKTSDE